MLWLLVVTLGVAATVVLSLDTTAVLLTPVVLALATRLGLAPAPLAMTTVWLANTASLLLPVSNLTNLLSLHRMQSLGVGLRGYLSLTWAPALATVAVTVLVLGLLFRGRLTGRYEAPRTPPRRTRPCSSLRPACACCSGRRSSPGCRWSGRRRWVPGCW